MLPAGKSKPKGTAESLATMRVRVAGREIVRLEALDQRLMQWFAGLHIDLPAEFLILEAKRFLERTDLSASQRRDLRNHILNNKNGYTEEARPRRTPTGGEWFSLDGGRSLGRAP